LSSSDLSLRVCDFLSKFFKNCSLETNFQRSKKFEELVERIYQHTNKMLREKWSDLEEDVLNFKSDYLMS